MKAINEVLRLKLVEARLDGHLSHPTDISRVGSPVFSGVHRWISMPPSIALRRCASLLARYEKLKHVLCLGMKSPILSGILWYHPRAVPAGTALPLMQLLAPRN